MDQNDDIKQGVRKISVQRSTEEARSVQDTHDSIDSFDSHKRSQSYFASQNAMFDDVYVVNHRPCEIIYIRVFSVLLW